MSHFELGAHSIVWAGSIECAQCATGNYATGRGDIPN